MKRYANITNGLAYPHDDVCALMSTHAHHYACGYLRLDSMPYSAAIELLKGRRILIIDATQHNKPLTDALRYGLPTWCRIFNRAIRINTQPVCDWETPHISRAAYTGPHAAKITQRIRRLAAVYGNSGPAIIGLNVLVECHRRFPYDDKPDSIKHLCN